MGLEVDVEMQDGDFLPAEGIQAPTGTTAGGSAQEGPAGAPVNAGGTSLAQEQVEEEFLTVDDIDAFLAEDSGQGEGSSTLGGEPDAEGEEEVALSESEEVQTRRR
ncbi:hypothetical protein H0H92_015964, partial [Tricholoma furcatifolium]